MEMLSLEQIQKTEYQILHHFHKVCTLHGLRYYLSNGTLLGAVKYRGFIPWDDDVDVLMPREDYDKLMALPDIDEGSYRLFARERNAAWKVPFAKLCDERTRVSEGSAFVGCEHGLSMDIFPIDTWRGSRRRAELQAGCCGLMRRCLSASLEETFITDKSGWKKSVLSLIWRFSRRMGPEFFYKGIQKQIQKGKDRPGNCCGSVAWSLYGKREVIDREIFQETVQVVFSGDEYPAPAGFDQYLRQLYGDYWLDLPPEQQKPHHHMNAWWVTDAMEP